MQGFAETATPAVAPPYAPAFLDVQDLSVRFGRQGRAVQALDDVSFSQQEGEFVSLLGPSGCGKSTLLFMIAGLLAPTSGRVTIAGSRLDGPYQQAGIVFQQDNLLEWRTVLENVLLPVEVRKLDRQTFVVRARELLAETGLAGFEDVYPHQLSGGMRQRASICRALVCDLPLLLLDEPFGALDAISREEHQLMLQAIWMRTRRTMIFVTHDIREAVLLSDRVVVMTPRPGRIRTVVEIDLPRPRTIEIADSAEFGAYVSRLRKLLGGEAAPAWQGGPGGAAQ